MPSTHKKVIVRKLNHDSLPGYVASSFIADGKLEVLNTSGTLVRMDLADVKGVYFVRDFADSEELTRKTFATRPRAEGLWVRIRFRDNEVIEGTMPNDLTQIGAEGFLINPPDTRSNTQRIFAPRSAVAELKILGVIGTQSRKRPAAPDERQKQMFTE
jgi:hypothetical protein